MTQNCFQLCFIDFDQKNNVLPNDQHALGANMEEHEFFSGSVHVYKLCPVCFGQGIVERIIEEIVDKPAL